ncbi:hypothetical protein UYSO10_0556 [Kosakonia radicincitans]|nr:hypothetical protein UYSO10_0556 [Kosakonia radicincitans]
MRPYLRCRPAREVIIASLRNIASGFFVIAAPYSPLAVFIYAITVINAE